MAKSTTQFDKLKDAILNHKWIAIVCLAVAVIIGLASLTESLTKLWAFGKNITGSSSPVGESPLEDPDQYRNPKVEIEKLVSKWNAAFLSGDVDTIVKLTAEPSFFDQKVLLTKNDLRNEYLRLYRERGEEWKELEVSSIKVQTLLQLKEEGYDVEKDRVFTSLNLDMEDYSAVIGGMGVFVATREEGGKYLVVGWWD